MKTKTILFIIAGYLIFKNFDKIKSLFGKSNDVIPS
jgi:hypothetical protein